MGLKCGIVGLPNVGKSTLFNALTAAGIAAQNYPFCTIEPNIGVVTVPDQRLDQLAAIVNPKQILPAIVEFVDIAGLVKGAAKGEGLGNKFLANIRETNAIVHVVRCFINDDITHVAENISPIDDIETINTELLLADMETVNKALQKAAKKAKSGDKTALAEKELLTVVEEHLSQGLPARTLALDDTQQPMLHSLHLLTNKPIMYVANVSEGELASNQLYQQVKQYVEQQEEALVVPIIADLEAEIAALDPAEKQEFLQELNLSAPGLDRLIKSAYELLHLQTFFTAGEKEVRAWTVKINATAPTAAGCIHSDFEKGFIRAEVISFNDYTQHHGEAGAKEAGKWRLEGKDYIVQDGDIIQFRFNV